jgi:hypothetical protein
MTTIAYKDGIMAADTRASGDDVAFDVVKLWRLPNGDVAAGAGVLCRAALGIQWLQSRRGDAPDIEGADILFTDAGVPYVASGGWPGVRIRSYAAIGSGAQGAMVAMSMGLSAADAVQAVIGIDPATGGEVQTLAVKCSARKRARAG